MFRRLEKKLCFSKISEKISAGEIFCQRKVQKNMLVLKILSSEKFCPPIILSTDNFVRRRSVR